MPSLTLESRSINMGARETSSVDKAFVLQVLGCEFHPENPFKEAKHPGPRLQFQLTDGLSSPT